MSDELFPYAALLFPTDLKREEICCDNDNWAEQCQKAKELTEDNIEDKLLKYSMLNTINRNFISAASMYAKTIISELLLPDHLKSVPRCDPVEFGGYAGGMKYKWRGILFKIAAGNLGPYGENDEAAAKAMGHELKGANAYNRCNISDLNVALQALIDYKGFRIHAQAILKIDSDRTLMVGSADAGKHVHCRNPQLQSKFRMAARDLNICKHVVKDVALYSACDVEGHRDADGRFYVIDLARTFPPEHPDVAKHLNILEIGSMVMVRKSAFYECAVGHDRDEWIEGCIVGASSAVESSAKNCKLSSRYSSFKVSTKIGNCEVTDIRNIVNSKMSIFWRFLRPEFVKHRGRFLIAAMEGTVSRPLNATGDSDDDLGSLPPVNPFLKKAALSTASTMSDTSGARSDGSSVSHVYNSFYVSVDGVSNHQENLEPPVPGTGFHNGGETVRPLDACAHAPGSPVALSPDALSEFSKGDPDRAFHNTNVAAATDVLLCRLIPAMVHDLLTNGHPSGREGHGEGSLSLPEYLHRHGINMRHVGLLRACIPDPKTLSNGRESDGLPNDPKRADLCYRLRAELLLQCVSRTLKNLLRDILRKWVRAQQSDVSEQAIRQILIQFLNLVSGAHVNSELFWRNEVRCGIRKRFGNVALTSEEDPILAASAGSHVELGPYYVWNISRAYFEGSTSEKIPEQHTYHGHEEDRLKLNALFQENCLVALIHDVCYRNGIRITDECNRQMCNGDDHAVLGFEFVTADIVDIVPVVKHMHQVDMAEGIVLSLAAEQRELKRRTSSDGVNRSPLVGLSSSARGTNSSSHGIISRLSHLSINRLQRALRAVPDDPKAGAALADAYQTLAVASSRQGYDKEAEKAFKMFRNLHVAPFAKCSKSGLSYKDDILGVVVNIEYHSDKYKTGITKRPPVGGKSDANQQSISRTSSSTSLERDVILRNWPIKEVYVDLNCLSLTTFLGADDDAHIVRAPDSQKEMKPQQSRQQDSMKKRFIPLIIDTGHADRALPLLMEELVRMDCLKGDFYEFSGTISPKRICVQGRSATCDHGINGSTVAIRHLPASLAWKAHEAANATSSQPSAKKQRSRRKRHSEKSTQCEGLRNSECLILNDDSRSELVGNGSFEEADSLRIQRGLEPPRLPVFSSTIGFRVISAVMNSMISQFVMAAENKIRLSSDSLVGYMSFHHMLLYFAARDPTWRATSNAIVESFVQNPAERHKNCTPDLGRFLVHLLLSERGWDHEVSRAYVLECFKRQVSWFLDPAGGKFRPGLAYLETEPISPYRLDTTFKVTLVGLRNLMFQIYFMHSVAGRDGRLLMQDNEKFSIVRGRGCFSLELKNRHRSSVSYASAVKYAFKPESGQSDVPSSSRINCSTTDDESILSVYDKSLGCPTAALRKDINIEFEEILKVSSYNDFLNRVGLRGTPEEVTSLLRNAVRDSVFESHYHRHRLYGNVQAHDNPGGTCGEPKYNISCRPGSIPWCDVSAVCEQTAHREEDIRAKRIHDKVSQERANKKGEVGRKKSSVLDDGKWKRAEYVSSTLRASALPFQSKGCSRFETIGKK